MVIGKESCRSLREAVARELLFYYDTTCILMDRHRVSVTYVVVRNLEFNGEFLAVGIAEFHIQSVGFIGDVFLFTLPHGVGVAACPLLGLAQGDSIHAEAASAKRLCNLMVVYMDGVKDRLRRKYSRICHAAYIAKALKPPSTMATVPVTKREASLIR